MGTARMTGRKDDSRPPLYRTVSGKEGGFNWAMIERVVLKLGLPKMEGRLAEGGGIRELEMITTP